MASQISLQVTWIWGLYPATWICGVKPPLKSTRPKETPWGRCNSTRIPWESWREKNSAKGMQVGILGLHRESYAHCSPIAPTSGIKLRDPLFKNERHREAYVCMLFSSLWKISTDMIIFWIFSSTLQGWNSYQHMVRTRVLILNLGCIVPWEAFKEQQVPKTPLPHTHPRSLFSWSEMRLRCQYFFFFAHV